MHCKIDLLFSRKQFRILIHTFVSLAVCSITDRHHMIPHHHQFGFQHQRKVACPMCFHFVCVFGAIAIYISTSTTIIDLVGFACVLPVNVYNHSISPSCIVSHSNTQSFAIMQLYCSRIHKCIVFQLQYEMPTVILPRFSDHLTLVINQSNICIGIG